MLHNLFNLSLHILSGSKSLTLQIWPAPQYMWPPFFEYSLPASYVFEQIHTFLPSFHNTWFFWHHRFNAYTHSLWQISESSCWSLSFFSGPFFSLLLPVYLLSSPFPLFVLHTCLHINLSLISTDLRKFSFPSMQKSLTLTSFFSLNRHICGYCFLCLYVLITSYHPFFGIMNRLSSFFASFFSQLCIIFLTEQQHSLLLLLFLYLLIDINSPSFPSLGRACITTHPTPLPCTVNN